MSGSPLLRERHFAPHLPFYTLCVGADGNDRLPPNRGLTSFYNLAYNLFMMRGYKRIRRHIEWLQNWYTDAWTGTIRCEHHEIGILIHY